jgi:hypothetical protein
VLLLRYPDSQHSLVSVIVSIQWKPKVQLHLQNDALVQHSAQEKQVYVASGHDGCIGVYLIRAEELVVMHSKHVRAASKSDKEANEVVKLMEIAVEACLGGADTCSRSIDMERTISRSKVLIVNEFILN